MRITASYWFAATKMLLMAHMKPGQGRIKERLFEIIFEADTWGGRTFDVALLLIIGVSVFAVILESVAHLREAYGTWLRVVEWICTALFTVEYALRIYCVAKPWRYLISFFGIVDLLAILPSYLSFFIPNAHELLVIRAVRLLRVFRILKITRYVGESTVLMQALLASRRKIALFLLAVLTLALILGAAMHVIEGPQHGFVDIPTGMYWAIVTLTTVGYGDLSPATPLGRFLACVVMILGYSIIAVPTGIVSVELNRASQESVITCHGCGRQNLLVEANFCPHCGMRL